jgi:hypothetical protein
VRRPARKLLAAVPLPLALLVAVAAVLTLTWSLFQPPFQGPDEAGHVEYVQRIVEGPALPWKAVGGCDGCVERGSVEFRHAYRESGLQAMQGNLSAKDTASHADEAIWHASERRLPEDSRSDFSAPAASEPVITGGNATLRNPPAYYLYAAVPYAATYPADLFGRSLAMRLWNIPLIAAVVAGTWVLTGLLLGGRRWLQTVAAAIVAVNAQLVDLAATVNADILLAALYTAALALMALVLVRGSTRGRWIALAAVTVLAGLTHPRGAALLAPVAITAAIVWWRATAPHDRRARRLGWAGAGAAAALAALVTFASATGGSLRPGPVREFASYLWQFYLPRPGFMTPTLRADWDARDVFVDRFWGTFAQFDVVSNASIDIMALLAPLGLIAFVAFAVARRRSLWRMRAVAGVLLLAVVSYLLASHVGAWRTLTDGSSDPVMTGRYLLPFVALLGAGVAALVSWLPVPVRAPAAAAAVFGALALQLSALGALVHRFHV